MIGHLRESNGGGALSEKEAFFQELQEQPTETTTTETKQKVVAPNSNSNSNSEPLRVAVLPLIDSSSGGLTEKENLENSNKIEQELNSTNTTGITDTESNSIRTNLLNNTSTSNAS